MEGLATEAARILFTEAGLIGVVAVLLGIVAVSFHRDIRKCNDARVDDARSVSKALEESSKAINGFSLALESNNRVMEARTRATEMLAGEMKELRQQVTFLEKLLDELRRRGGDRV